MTIHPKVFGAVGGVGVGGAIATLVVWGLTAHGINPPSDVEPAIGTLFDAALAALGAWLVPSAAAEPPQ